MANGYWSTANMTNSIYNRTHPNQCCINTAKFSGNNNAEDVI